ncbi:hypothetical protein DRO69_10660 [Candidatus Bathyarchaeota archaeon]|nr:MAG: hypothetical protein DRO69_10660 [Candidatus Bathyarchaeota archaeon]
MSGKERMKEYEKKLCEMKIPTTKVSGSGKVHIEGIGNIQISGSGFISPEEIRISGSGRLPGGLNVGRITCSGSVSIGGNIEAEEIKISGSGSIVGNVRTKAFSAAGSVSINGWVKGSVMKVAGSCTIGGAAELTNTLRAHGSLKVLGDVKAKSLVELHGSFDIDGKVITENFDAELRRSDSHIKNGIEAVNVSVKKKEVEGLVIFGFPILGRIFRSGKLYTTNIKGEEVHLENVSCQDICGKNVIIGEGCIIKGKVKYSKFISVNSEANLANPPEKSKDVHFCPEF